MPDRGNHRDPVHAGRGTANSGYPGLYRAAACPLGRDRIVTDSDEVIRRRPDIVIGSCCGKKFRLQRVAARPGCSAVPAVAQGQLHEIKSSLILQPGPAALTDGLRILHGIISRWAQRQPPAAR